MNYEPNNITDCVLEAHLALEKGLLILGDLTTDFPHDGERANYIEAWDYEYQRITKFIDIAFDYMYEGAQKVERARKLEEALPKEKRSSMIKKDVFNFDDAMESFANKAEAAECGGFTKALNKLNEIDTLNEAVKEMHKIYDYIKWAIKYKALDSVNDAIKNYQEKSMDHFAKAIQFFYNSGFRDGAVFAYEDVGENEAEQDKDGVS